MHLSLLIWFGALIVLWIVVLYVINDVCTRYQGVILLEALPRGTPNVLEEAVAPKLLHPIRQICIVRHCLTFTINRDILLRIVQSALVGEANCLAAMMLGKFCV